METVALLNSGFKSEDPNIVVPVELARRLGSWPPKTANSALLDTGGGEVDLLYYESIAELEILVGDRKVDRVIVNIIVNPYVHEVSLSDYLVSLLGIIIVDAKRGFWRFKDDKESLLRHSHAAEEW